jgi:serine protease
MSPRLLPLALSAAALAAALTPPPARASNAGASPPAATSSSEAARPAASASDSARPAASASHSAHPAASAPDSALPVGGPADAEYRTDQVVVRYAPAGAHAARAEAVRTRAVKVARGQSVAATLRALRAQPGVISATRDYVAHASGWIPVDPGSAGTPAGWQQLQWNFMPIVGVNAPDAWQHLMAVGRPGGRGVTVAVLDTGIAYADHGRYKRSPDFPKGRFVKGYDFVDNDPFPNDENGHGTHVAGTIAEGTGNALGVTGLAYGVRLMPVRVLDRAGEGDSTAISAGIRWAADHGGQVINLSFEFGSGVTRQQIPDILSALRHARQKGVLVVGASGNAAAQAVAYPARSSDVLSVGATTQHDCQADYSNEGQDLDVVAPGGGPDAALDGDANCHPLDPPGADIFQMTFDGSVHKFGLPSGYIGTSMAAPHAAATAALVIASGLLGANPTPAAIERRLEHTAHDLGPPGHDPHYGWGLIDAAAATDPAIPVT